MDGGTGLSMAIVVASVLMMVAAFAVAPFIESTWHPAPCIKLEPAFAADNQWVVLLDSTTELTLTGLSLPLHAQQETVSVSPPGIIRIRDVSGMAAGSADEATSSGVGSPNYEGGPAPPC